ncbi:hypothetical protein OYC64_010374 [Pagothenia borchgrevinki]|uniref:Uncharacterized protein n=1 Tax=Pagothenia borchgrevinki TaxID=8213 RepID=A0ABD2GWG1_PAGBO
MCSSGTTRTEAPSSPLTMGLSWSWNTGTSTWWSTRVKAAHLDLDQPVVLARPPRRGRPPALIPVAELRPVVPVSPLPEAAQAEVVFPTPVRRSRGGRPVVPPRHADFVYG